MVDDWLEQLGHGGRLVSAIGSWWPIGYLEQFGPGGRLVSN